MILACGFFAASSCKTFLQVVPDRWTGQKNRKRHAFATPLRRNHLREFIHDARSRYTARELRNRATSDVHLGKCLAQRLRSRHRVYVPRCFHATVSVAFILREYRAYDYLTGTPYRIFINNHQSLSRARARPSIVRKKYIFHAQS